MSEENRKKEEALSQQKDSGPDEEGKDLQQETDTPESVARKVKETRYPNLIDANNTKVIVLLSLVFVILIFVLSILFPAEQEQEEAKETTEYRTLNVDPETGFAKMEDAVYYYPKGINFDYYVGWYTLDEDTYYFDEKGKLVTGWQQVDGELRFFDENGVMAKDCWVEDHYLDEQGVVLRNTVTPDGGYVDAEGLRDDTVSLETSREGLTDLKEELTEMTTGYSGTWSVYVKDVEHNEYLEINNVQHFSASLIKLYCAATLYELMEQGTVEKTDTLERQMWEMISVSDNDAFNLLVMKCAPDNNHVTGRGIIQDYIDRNGYVDTTITSMLVPTKYPAPSSAGRNYTTVVDCGLLMEKIYKEQCVSEEASRDFLDLLLNQTHINKIPAGLPEGTLCANKTGDTDEVQHDVAIIYSPKGVYILSVMSTGCGAAIPNIQNISRVVYDYFNP